MANAIEQALLLPRDMADLKSMRKHEVFLSLKRDLTLVSPPTTPFIILLLLLLVLVLLLYIYIYIYCTYT